MLTAMEQYIRPGYYKVKFTAGEKELSSSEILVLFKAGKIFTTTEICPEEENNWRPLIEEPSLKSILAPGISLIREHQNLNTPIRVFAVFFLIATSAFAVAFYSLPNLGILGKYAEISLYSCFFSSIVQLLSGAYFVVDTKNKGAFVVPCINIYLGIREYRRIVERLSMRRKKRLYGLVYAIFSAAALLTLGLWFAPENSAGNIAVATMAVFAQIFYCAFVMAICPPLKQYNDNIRAQNPIPEDYKPPIFNFSNFAKELFVAIIALLLLIGPIWLSGIIRCRIIEYRNPDIPMNQVELLKHFERPEPHAINELKNIPLPDPPVEFYSLLAIHKSDIDPDFSAEVNRWLDEAGPDYLEALKIVQKTPSFGQDTEENQEVKKLRTLINFQRIRMIAQNRLYWQLFDALCRRIYDYSSENLIMPFYYTNTINNIRYCELERYINKLTGEQLSAEKDILARADENLVSTARIQMIANFVQVISLIEQMDTLKFYLPSFKAGNWSPLEKAISYLHDDYYVNAENINLPTDKDSLSALLFNHQELQHIIEKTNQYRTVYRLAQTGIALEQYRRKHGNFLETLEQLIPEFLTAVPLDPFDGKPLRYYKGDIPIHFTGIVKEDSSFTTEYQERECPGVKVWGIGRNRKSRTNDNSEPTFTILNNPISHKN